jgi:hypothetical protein
MAPDKSLFAPFGRLANWLASRLPALYVLALAMMLMLSLNACTYVAIEGPEYQATILTFTPTGNSTQFEGVLTGKGRVSLNRELGGAEGLVEEVGNAVRPLGGGSL